MSSRTLRATIQSLRRIISSGQRLRHMNLVVLLAARRLDAKPLRLHQNFLRQNFLHPARWRVGASSCLRLVRLSYASRVVLCVALAAATVLGCGWMRTSPSVRFNGWTTEREMGRLPPMPATRSDTAQESDGLDAGAHRDVDGDEKYERSQQRATETNKVWDEAGEATARGDLDATRQLLRAYLRRTSSVRDDWYSPDGRQARRNSAADQLDALDALDTGANVSSVSAYLAARRAYDAWTDGLAGPDDTGTQATGGASAPDDVRRALETVARARQLEDNAAYLRAAILYREAKMTDAARAFVALAARYPHSEKREAALFMASLVALKMSRTVIERSDDPPPAGETVETRDEDESETRAVDEDAATTRKNAAASSELSDHDALRQAATDRAWHEARDGFARVMREFPRGRYRADARGWLAYLYLHAGDRASALVEYYRLLGDAQAREEAVLSLKLTRASASDEEMRRVERELEDEPQPALAYAYHNIYNFARASDADYSGGDYDYQSDDDWEAKRAEAKRRQRTRTEKERIVRFATRMLRRYPRAEVGASFALRVAQANLELDRHHDALEQSRRALALGLPPDERAGALWVKGVAEHRTRDYATARATLARLVAENPLGELVEGARALIALAAEDAGDVEAALEQYMEMQYLDDVAYFIDVLMTPEQLKSFIERRPGHAQHDELLYALGVRYMRLGRYDAARRVYAQVRTRQLDTAYVFLSNNDCDDEDAATALNGVGYKCADPKRPDYSPEPTRGVRARWVLADLKTMDDLERLERAATHAAGDEAKAEALYQLAGYLYGASDLTFYNPAAWRGERFHSFYYGQTFRAPHEAQTMRRYMEQHEPLVCALDIYLRLARLYPQTRAARDALYTAAVCHERLSNFQLYWPEQYSQGLHAGDSMVTYKDVRRTYPRYQLPRGTVGWEPATRTVRGGPGWDAPPKAKPLTRVERLRRRIKRGEHILSQGWHLAGEIGGGHLRRWSLVGLSLYGSLFLFRRTRRTKQG